ncbi:MAG: translation elongation factor Ts [Erysipelotrichaceae bacterium]|nr:translation elongation factor Ts [Erysipelotrichaceae bacterium]
MANIKLIPILRDRTGAGMMDCKKALDACNDDVEKACDWLRENGIAKAAKKSGRIAAEGLSFVAVNGNDAAIVELNCETDFVCANVEFKDLLKKIANAVVLAKPSTLDDANALSLDGSQTIADAVVAATAKIGEKISFRRFAIVSKNDDELFGTYLHAGGKKGSIVVVKGGNEEVASNIAMQLVATVPTYVRKSDVPAEYVEKELKIRIEAAVAQGRPLNEKAYAGLRNKIAEEVSLESQEFILEDKVTVGAYLARVHAEVVSMTYYIVGEGIEKRQEDFAAEVMSQIK